MSDLDGRLTAEEFAALVESSADPRLEPVRAPVCRVLVQVAGAGAVHLHQGWLNRNAAAFLLYVRDDRYDFLTCGPDFGPAAIARVVRLGPNATPRATLASRTASVEALFADDPATRKDAFAELGTGTGAGWLAARAVVDWPGPHGEPAGRGLTMLRAADGIRVAEFPDPAADVVVWTPTTSTEIWRAIVALLPHDAELNVPVA